MIDQFECHHYCSVCASYLGMPQAHDETFTCVKCHFSISVEKSLHDRNYFLSIPLTYQIQDILENQGMHDICFHASDSNRIGINDMYDGTLYQMLRSDSEEDFLTLTFNSDGVPVFRSSKFNVWPILCCVNEIPPESRDKHVLLCAL